MKSGLGMFGALLTAAFLAGCGNGSEPSAPSAAAAPVEPYPLTTCVVSDEPLGSMGDPYVHVHEGREIKFCCKACLKEFDSDPETYVLKIEQAAPQS